MSVAHDPSLNTDIAGQVALVTGAAGNIGRAVAIALATRGAVVVAADHPGAAAALEDTRDMCRGANPTTTPATVTFDVTDSQAVEAVLSDAAAANGTPSLVFNNAGYQGAFANIIDYAAADLQRVLNVNVAGVFYVLQHSARLMREAGRPGVIVNTASMAGVGGAPNMPAYSASKAAVIGLTKSAAKDLAPFGIRVNALSPGFIGPGVMWDGQVEKQAAVDSQYYASTPDAVAAQMIGQIPLRRYGSLDEVAKAALFLLSDDSSYVTGINLELSGGAA